MAKHAKVHSWSDYAVLCGRSVDKVYAARGREPVTCLDCLRRLHESREEVPVPDPARGSLCAKCAKCGEEVAPGTVHNALAGPVACDVVDMIGENAPSRIGFRRPGNHAWSLGTCAVCHLTYDEFIAHPVTCTRVIGSRSVPGVTDDD